MKKLFNKVAVVTGAGSGIGRAIAQAFAAEGCKVMVSDINPERVQETVDAIRSSENEATGLIANMAEQKDAEALVDAAVNTYGSLDILVNNAGVMDNFEPVGLVEDNTWDRVMKVNVDGPFFAMRKAVQYFATRGSGNIINVCSIGGIKGGVAGAAYTTSKHALIGLTKSTGYMYAKTGIRCNGIAPGAVETRISETIDMTNIPPLAQERIMPGMALNPRSGKPEEIAQAALFLASDASSFVNGHILVADGGWTA